MPTDVTLIAAQAIIDQARVTAGMERNQVISDQDLLNRLKLAVAEYYDLLIDDGETYFMSTLDESRVILDDARQYTFPDDFYKLWGVDYQLNGIWQPLDEIPFAQRNDYRYNTAWPVGYQLRGSRGLPTGKQVSVLQVLPEQYAPLSGYRAFYCPKALVPTDFADKVDCINGYDKFLIADLAGFMLTKTPRLEDAQMQWALCEKVRREVRERKANRILGTPAHVTRTRSRAAFPYPFLPRN